MQIGVYDTSKFYFFLIQKLPPWILLFYSDKFTLHMVDLTHIEIATEEDKAWNMNYWARLFTATTWEDVKMIAERCRARDDYRKQINTHNRTLQELEEAHNALEAKDKELEAKDKELELLKQQLAELQSSHTT